MPTDFWSKAGEFVVKIGVPSAIAIYLVYVLTNNLSAEIKDVRDKVDTHTTQAAEMMRQYEQVRIQSDRQLYVMQRICINSAKTQQERNECVAR